MLAPLDVRFVCAGTHATRQGEKEECSEVRRPALQEVRRGSYRMYIRVVCTIEWRSWVVKTAGGGCSSRGPVVPAWLRCFPWSSRNAIQSHPDARAVGSSSSWCGVRHGVRPARGSKCGTRWEDDDGRRGRTGRAGDSCVRSGAVGAGSGKPIYAGEENFYVFSPCEWGGQALRACVVRGWRGCVAAWPLGAWLRGLLASLSTSVCVCAWRETYAGGTYEKERG